MAPVSRSYSETFTSSPSAWQKAGSWLSSSRAVGHLHPAHRRAVAPVGAGHDGEVLLLDLRITGGGERPAGLEEPPPHAGHVAVGDLAGVVHGGPGDRLVGGRPPPPTAFETRRAWAPYPSRPACVPVAPRVVDLVVERPGAAPAVLTVDAPLGVLGGLEVDRADHRPDRSRAGVTGDRQYGDDEDHSNPHGTPATSNHRRELFPGRAKQGSVTRSPQSPPRCWLHPHRFARGPDTRQSPTSPKGSFRASLA